MKRLVIHAGMAKTGSSSIQESLWQARAELAGQGIHYPDWKPFNHSFELSALFRANRKKGFLYRQHSPISDEDWARELDKLRERWLAFFRDAPAGTSILSAESLEHFQPPELQDLVDTAAAHYDRVQVILYVRHPRSAISSRFEQGVKQLREATDPEDILAAAKQQARFGLLRRWQKVSGVDEIIVRPFEREQFPEGQLLQDFFRALDLPAAPATVAAQAANTSLGRNAVAFLLAHNSRLPLYTDEGLNPLRGLAGRQELLFRLIRRIDDEPLALDIRFSEAEATELNREIEFVNGFLDPQARLAPVQASAEPTALPGADELSPAFLSDLVNALAQELDRSLDDQRHLANALREAQGED